MDFSQLKPVKATPAELKTTKTFVPDEQHLKILQTTHASGEPAKTTVPASVAVKYTSWLRKHTDHLGLGLSRRISDPDKDGNVTVTFAAKDKRGYSDK